MHQSQDENEKQPPLLKKARSVHPTHRYGSANTCHKFTESLRVEKTGMRYTALQTKLEGCLNTHIVPTDEVRGFKEWDRGCSSDFGVEN
jgi:hypothetical protein